VNHFQAAGGMAFLVRELIANGLVHADVTTAAGDLHAYAREPHLDDGTLAWRDAPRASLDLDILRPVADPFDSEGGLRVLRGNLGRSVIKISSVAPEHRIIEAPAVVFHDQEHFLAAFKAGELNKDLVAVIRFQGPKANGMPELHKLTPQLGVLQDRGFKVALVTDGRMSGASGKVPAAIHVTPEAIESGPLARLRTGDMVRLDVVAGVLEANVPPEIWDARELVQPDLSTNDHGLGRELFAHIRRQITGAEAGASMLGDLAA
jgi:phosphogluconate dehydratase